MADDAASWLLTLPEGRTLHVWEGGDPDGVPVVFHPGTPCGRLQAVLGDESAQHQRVRLISFNRPGYGRSTDTPPSLASVGLDTVRVAEAVGIDEFAVLGASGGGPYALATGLADPGKVRAVGVAAGIGPWRLIDPPVSEDPDRPLLALADAGDVNGALQGFRARGTVAFSRMLTLADQPMVEEFLQDDADTGAGWLDAQAKRRWAADLRDALQSFDGFARDNVAWGGHWDIDPASLRVPVWLWYGQSDRSVPPSHGRWLANRIPDATLTIRHHKDHGETIFEYWDDMLATLRDHVSTADPI